MQSLLQYTYTSITHILYNFPNKDPILTEFELSWLLKSVSNTSGGTSHSGRPYTSDTSATLNIQCVGVTGGLEYTLIIHRRALSSPIMLIQ